jgi:hypothetical protein
MNKARRGWLGKCRGLQSDQDISCQALADWMERNNKSDMMCTITKTTQQKRALFFQFVFFVGARHVVSALSLCSSVVPLPKDES